MKSRIMAALSCLMGKPTIYGFDYRRIECYRVPKLFDAQARRRGDNERMYISGASSPSAIIETIRIDVNSSREIREKVDRAFDHMDHAFATMDDAFAMVERAAKKAKP